MTPAARLQAAIEILDSVIASARDDGPPADAIVTRYFKTRRYAGSGDRRAVRELVFRAIRRTAEGPESGRFAILGLAKDERALLDFRVNAARASRDELLAEFPGAEPTGISPWGIRLPPDTRIDDHPAFTAGLVEAQDEGSQLIVISCEARDGDAIIDLCAGAGGKSLALAAAAPQAKILATDSNRARLAQLADWRDKADLVLVDAPCSGSGTWRRNPEGRWRLTPERLERVIALQAR